MVLVCHASHVLLLVSQLFLELGNFSIQLPHLGLIIPLQLIQALLSLIEHSFLLELEFVRFALDLFALRLVQVIHLILEVLLQGPILVELNLKKVDFVGRLFDGCLQLIAMVNFESFKIVIIDFLIVFE